MEGTSEKAEAKRRTSFKFKMINYQWTMSSLTIERGETYTWWRSKEHDRACPQGAPGLMRKTDKETAVCVTGNYCKAS